MAAPPEVTSKNLTGKFVMNKTLSDDSDPLLKTQGISWFTRKAIAIATVTLTIKQYDEASVSHINIISNASGLSSTEEHRVLNWNDRDHTDRIFGKCVGKSRFTTKGAVEAETGNLSPGDLEFLNGKVLKDGKTGSEFLEQDSVQSFVRNVDKGYEWTAEQIWNFEMVGEKRRYTRRVVVKDKDGKITEKARLVYDYLGPVEGGDDALAYGENN